MAKKWDNIWSNQACRMHIFWDI